MARAIRSRFSFLAWTQGAEVVHPVSELDDQHSQVDGRGHDHLAERLRLRVVAPPRAVELGDAVDQDRHLRAELGLHLPDQQVGVLDRVVQQGRRQRGGVHPDRGQQLRDGQRMRDVGRAGLARLAPVIVLGHLEGTQEQADVGAREDPPVLSDQRPDGGGHPARGPARGSGEVVDQAVGAHAKRSGPGRHCSPVNPCSLVVIRLAGIRGRGDVLPTGEVAFNYSARRKDPPSRRRARLGHDSLLKAASRAA